MEIEAGYKGLSTPNSGEGQFNAINFLVRQILNRVRTATLVKIVAVTNSGGVSPVGFVDVQPLVNQLDGYGNAIPHGLLHHLPYMRLQGGANAVIIDPQVDDIGIAVFADRDISSVAANRAQANPGSFRQFDMADGMYIGGVLNGAPTQFVQFETGGITITSPNKITLTAPAVQINGIVTVTGDLTAEGTSVHTHKHGGVQAGGSQTGVPV
jgi:hypothetical protein